MKVQYNDAIDSDVNTINETTDDIGRILTMY